jgi:hypothetical protein
VTRQVEAWTWELAGWVDRVSPVFARPEPWELLQQMTVGLLSPLPKKNGWTLAEQAGHTHPGRIQTFLCRGAWDATVIQAASGKDGAEANFKGYGFHPLTACCSNVGDALAAMPRPGSAGSFTAAENGKRGRRVEYSPRLASRGPHQDRHRHRR